MAEEMKNAEALSEEELEQVAGGTRAEDVVDPGYNVLAKKIMESLKENPIKEQIKKGC